MRTVAFFLALLLFSGTVRAQSFTGTYTTQTSNGILQLTLQPEASGRYAGTLAVGGQQFTVQAEEGEGGLSGLLSGNGVEYALGGALEGNNLALYLIPLDANRSPQYDAAEQLVLARQGGSSAGASDLFTPSSTPEPSAPLGTMTTTPSTSGFSGTYAGDFNGTPMSLTLQQQGTTLNGVADAEGYRYQLSGTVNGTTARGTFSDPQNGGSLTMELVLQGDQLTLTIMSQDPNTGQISRLPIHFRRGGAAAGGGAAPMGSMPHGGASQGAQAGDQNVERDPSLVGMWSFTETMVSGEFSSVTQLQLQINPDGTFLYGNGRTMAGGSSAYGSISGDTGYGGDVSRGTWRTQGNIVYIQENGMGQWMPYARYYVEGGSMMFTFGDGSRQVWKRR